MIRVRQGRVLTVDSSEEGVSHLTVLVDGGRARAVSYDDLTGSVSPGDRVLLNTTAVHLGLGTGGAHFVMGVIGRQTEYRGTGHIMKCRYTPAQVAVLAVEEPASPYHGAMQDGDLGGLPVIVATLHSMVPAAAAVLKAKRPEAAVVYVMTDGAALPVRFSRLVSHMKRAGLLDAVITAGHAFGGVEAVTVYSASVKKVCGRFAIVAMGRASSARERFGERLRWSKERSWTPQPSCPAVRSPHRGSALPTRASVTGASVTTP